MIVKKDVEGYGLSALRVAAGLGFWSHGAQKLFGWFGGVGPDGGAAVLMSRFGAAGVIEFFLGTFLVFGLFTRFSAFIASGQMAVAYFWMHAAGAGSLWWWANQGELAMIYAFLWLYIAVVGGGPLSLDALWPRRTPQPAQADDRSVRLAA